MIMYAIRHAESLANAGLDEGLNSALSERGLAQAEAVGGRFAGCAAFAVYSSPFLRAIQTAEPVSRRLRLPIRVRPELCEYQGLPAGAEVDLGLGDIEAITAAGSGAVRCPDHERAFDWPTADETLAAMISRTRAFVAYLKRRWVGRDDVVLVFGHGSPIARLIEAWLTDQPGPAFRFAIDNAAVAGLRYVDGVSSLICLNEASHLRSVGGGEVWSRDREGRDVW
jgi:broad specificity phosphatase PhoE